MLSSNLRFESSLEHMGTLPKVILNVILKVDRKALTGAGGLGGCEGVLRVNFERVFVSAKVLGGTIAFLG